MNRTDRNWMRCHPPMAWSLLVCLLLSHRGGAEELSASQVVKELRSGIARLKAEEVRLSTWECVAEWSRGGEKPTSGTFLVKRHGASVLLDITQTLKPDHLRAVKNDSEMFEISSKTSSRGWVLSGHVKPISDDIWHKALSDGRFAVYPLLVASGKSTILNLLDDKSFVPTRARKVAENRVELDYEVTDGDSTGRGTFTLAPDLDWLVVRLTITHTSPSGGSGRTTFSRDAFRDGDQIRVKSVAFEAGVEGKPQYGSKSKYTYKLLAPDTVDPAEFTLAHYNLIAPETPDAYEDRPPFNWRIWGGVGVACIVLSLVLGWYVRRRTT